MCSLEGCGSHAEMPPLIVPEAQRRDFLRGLIALPLAAVLSDKALAEAAASSLETVSLPIPDGQAMTMSVEIGRAHV